MPLKILAPILTAVLTIVLITGCTLFNAAPPECIEAAEDARLPDSVIEQLRNPAGLNALERAALQQALNQAEIDDVCDIGAVGQPSTTSADNLPAPFATAVSEATKSAEEASRREGTESPVIPTPSETVRIPQTDDPQRIRSRHKSARQPWTTEQATLNAWTRSTCAPPTITTNIIG